MADKKALPRISRDAICVGVFEIEIWQNGQSILRATTTNRLSWALYSQVESVRS